MPLSQHLYLCLKWQDREDNKGNENVLQNGLEDIFLFKKSRLYLKKYNHRVDSLKKTC